MAPPHFGDTNPPLGRGEKNHHSPSMGLAPISWFGTPMGLWGGCSPSQPLLVVQWILQLNSRAEGTPVHPQVLPWKAKSCQQQAGAGLAGVPVHRQ